tara:strand:+ start:6581 stop:7681 length:1101 start_codon:yes stop_codon:yes gene_type:complete
MCVLIFKGNKMSDLKVTIIGVGGAGCNTINRLKDKQFTKYNLLAVNTDTQMLETMKTSGVFAIGPILTEGFGSGGNPRIGREAAKESLEQLTTILKDQDLVILTTGLGGGTGTGATPVIASLAKKLGALVIVVATHPFAFEGNLRKQYSEKAVKSILRASDSFIEINNDGLLTMNNENKSLDDSFKHADIALINIVEEITSVIADSGLINIDFADVKNILTKSGKTYISKAKIDKNQKIDDIYLDLKQNLLINYGFKSAKKLLLSIKSSPKFSLNDLNTIATKISSFLYEPQNILIGVNNNFHKKSIIEATIIASDLKFSFNDEINKNPFVFNDINNQIYQSENESVKINSIFNFKRLIKLPAAFQ